MLLLTCHLQVPDSCPLSTYLEMKAECIPLCSSHVKGFLVSVINPRHLVSREAVFELQKSMPTCLSYVAKTHTILYFMQIILPSSPANSKS